MFIEISKRKHNSNEKAQLVCRELRHLIAENDPDQTKLVKLLQDWCSTTGKIRYKRPE